MDLETVTDILTESQTFALQILNSHILSLYVTTTRN